jgi:hypothetical protein
VTIRRAANNYDKLAEDAEALLTKRKSPPSGHDGTAIISNRGRLSDQMPTARRAERHAEALIQGLFLPQGGRHTQSAGHGGSCIWHTRSAQGSL